jgi:hypothetical protein
MAYVEATSWRKRSSAYDLTALYIEAIITPSNVTARDTGYGWDI